MIKLLTLGDICPSCLDKTNFKNSTGYISLVENLKTYDGLIYANLECVLSDCKNTNLNKISLSCNPGYIKYLSFIDIFSLSNNHIYDLGPEGVKDTINILNNNKKKYFGYGENINEARKPLIINKNGIKLGLIGYNSLTTNGENYATDTKEGTSPIALDYLKTDILNLKKSVDHIIVSLHWGPENKYYPTPDQIMLGHKLVNFGASIIVGTHPHLIQGIETFNKRTICYSLGNFIFSDLKYKVLNEGEILNKTVKQLQGNTESIGVEFLIDKDTVTVNMIRAYQLDEYFLPHEVNIQMLNTNFYKNNASLKKYIKKNSRYIDRIKELQMMIKFNGRIYQNRYSLKPINEIGYQNISNVKTIGKNLLSKIIGNRRKK